MANFRIILLLLTTFIGRNSVSGRPNSGIDSFQSFLDQLCGPQSTHDGCKKDGIISTTTPAPPGPFPAPPGPFPAPPGPFPAPTEPPGGSQTTPPIIDIRDEGVPCTIPTDPLLVLKTLICGDGTNIGLFCGHDGRLPSLSLLLVQCYAGIDEDYVKPITSVNAVSEPGGKGGAGIYRCSPKGKWESWNSSPDLPDLLESCRNDGCGRIPHPTKNMKVWRRWSWVRSIYKDGTVHCTATLVSPTAAVTAAHCLTKNIGDEFPDEDYTSDFGLYQLELPGLNSPSVTVSLQHIYFHPSYKYNNGNPQHDLAVVFFQQRRGPILPTVCITDRYYRRTQGTEVTFSQKMEAQNNEWSYAISSLDQFCSNTKVNIKYRCQKNVNIQQSQLCGTHKGLPMNGSSHGEPYLVDVGEGQEVWQLVGIRSNISTISSCSLENSIYEQVADNTQWVKNCVFDKNKCEPKST